MLDLEDIRAFVETAETGSLGAAGRRIGLSTSMISRRLTRLEGELGAQLLTRTTRGVALTEAGEAFRVHAERALSDLEAARDSVAHDAGELTGVLRIAAPLSFGAAHLAPALADFAARHSRLEIETDYSDRFVNLVAERFDAAVRIGQLADSSLIARKIADIKLALVASPAYLAANGAPETPADLEKHAALIQPGEVWRFGSGRRETTVRPNARFRANSGQAVADAAIAGLGVALLPTFLIGHAIGEGKLAPVMPEVCPPEAGLFVVRAPPASHAPPKIRALTDFLLERFGGEPTWDACYGKDNNTSAI